MKMNTACSCEPLYLRGLDELIMKKEQQINKKACNCLDCLIHTAEAIRVIIEA